MSPSGTATALASVAGKLTRMTWSRVADWVLSPRRQVGPRGEIKAPPIFLENSSKASSADCRMWAVMGF